MAMKGLHMKAVSVHIAMEQAVAAVPAVMRSSSHASLLICEMLSSALVCCIKKPQIGCSGGVRSGQVVAGRHTTCQTSEGSLV